MVKCKFEHGGYCCNRGAMQYMDKCEKPCDTIIPVTNAGRVRAMSDEELAAWLAKLANGDVYTDFCDNPARTVVCDSKCVGCIAEWLKQPAKDGDNDD